MGIAAITHDYLHANSHALKLWRETYSNLLGTSPLLIELIVGIALTDTFSTEIFLKDFTKDLASKCSGVRQDSGDPIAFVPRIVRHYKENNVSPREKTIVFSDSLDVERCLELKKWADKHGIGSSFGVGTFLTSNPSLWVSVNSR
jgi:nicotinate phosphoribosyltransferase